MGANSGVAWTDATFNAWWGCTKVGPGCTWCYGDGWASTPSELRRLRASLARGARSVTVSDGTLRLLLDALDAVDDMHRRATVVVGTGGLGHFGRGVDPPNGGAL